MFAYSTFVVVVVQEAFSMESCASGRVCKWDANILCVKYRKDVKNTLHLPDSCPVLHVRDHIEVCSWRLHEHAWSFYISRPSNRLRFLLQLLRHEGGVPRHGDNGFSLCRCHRLLLPNQSEGMKRLLCL